MRLEDVLLRVIAINRRAAALSIANLIVWSSIIVGLAWASRH